MAKADENIGSAVGTAVGTALLTARQGAVAASRNSAATSRRVARKTAKQARRRLAERGIDREHLQDLQDAFAENVWKARHELASRIEPPSPRRRPRLRILLLIAVLGAIAGAIAAAMSRRTVTQASEQDRTLDASDMSDNGSAPRQLDSTPVGTVKPVSSTRATTTDETTSSS